MGVRFCRPPSLCCHIYFCSSSSGCSASSSSVQPNFSPQKGHSFVFSSSRSYILNGFLQLGQRQKITVSTTNPTIITIAATKIAVLSHVYINPPKNTLSSISNTEAPNNILLIFLIFTVFVSVVLFLLFTLCVLFYHISPTFTTVKLQTIFSCREKKQALRLFLTQRLLPWLHNGDYCISIFLGSLFSSTNFGRFTSKIPLL